MSELLDRIAGDSPSKNWMRAHLDYPHKDWCLIYHVVIERDFAIAAAINREWRK